MATVHLVKTPDQWVHQARQQADSRTGFGEWLKRAREARGLTLADITRETKIPLRNLEALEHGDLGFVPAFYQRAEVRAIARAVGVDEGLAVGRLDSAVTPAAPEPKPRVPPSTQKIALPVALGALAFGLLVWTVASPGRTSPGRNSHEPVARASQPSDADVAPAAATAGATSVAGPVETAAASPIPAADAAAEEQTAPRPVTELVVRTEPAGAQVTVNGIGWGVSPVTIRHLPPGTKHIRVTKEGFAATQRVVTIDSGQQQALDLHMTAGQ